MPATINASSMASRNSNTGSQKSVSTTTKRGVGAVLMEEAFNVLPRLEITRHLTPGSGTETLTLLHLILESLQILAFCFLPYHNWGTIANGTSSVLWLVTLPLFDGLNGGFIAALVIMCVILLILLIAGVIICVALQDSEIVMGPMLDRAAIPFHLVSTALFIPLLSNFVALGWCHYPTTTLTWFPDQPCFDGLGILALVVGVVGVLLLVSMTLLSQTILFPGPDTTHRFARVSPRFDIYFIFGKILSVVLFHHFLNQRQPLFAAICPTVCVFVGGLLTADLLHYSRLRTTIIKVNVQLVGFSLGGLGMLTYISEVRTFFQEDDWNLDIVFAILLAIGFIVLGTLLSNLRVSRLFKFRLRELTEGVIEDRLGFFPLNLPKGDLIFQQSREIQQALLSPDELADETDDEYHFTTSYIDFISRPEDVKIANRFLDHYRQVTGFTPTQHMLAFAARIFAKGVLKYPDSPFLILQLSQFLSGTCARPKLAHTQLMKNQRLFTTSSYAASYAFGVIESDISADIVTGGRNQVSKAYRSVKSNFGKLTRQMSEFWVTVSDKDMDVGRCSTLSSAIMETRSAVGEEFDRLLNAHPKNMEYVSSYTAFCDLLMDTDAKDQCISYLGELQERRKQRARGGREEKRDLTSSRPSSVHVFTAAMSATAESVRTFTRSVSVSLILFALAFLVLRLVTFSYEQKQINSTYYFGEMRSLSVHCGDVAQRFFHAVNTGVDQPTQDRTLAELSGLLGDFKALVNSLTHGAERTDAFSEETMFSTTETNFAIQNSQTLSLFTLRYMLPVALRNIVRNNTFPAITWVLDDMPLLVSTALNNSVILAGEASKETQSTEAIGGNLLLIFAGLVVVTACVLVHTQTLTVLKSTSQVFALFRTIGTANLAQMVEEGKTRVKESEKWFKMSVSRRVDHLLGVMSVGNINDVRGGLQASRLGVSGRVATGEKKDEEGEGSESGDEGTEKHSTTGVSTLSLAAIRGRKNANEAKMGEGSANSFIFVLLLTATLCLCTALLSVIPILLKDTPGGLFEAELRVSRQIREMATSFRQRAAIAQSIVAHSTENYFAAQHGEIGHLKDQVELLRADLFASKLATAVELAAFRNFQRLQTTCYEAETVAIRLAIPPSRDATIYETPAASVTWPSAATTSRPYVLPSLSEQQSSIAHKRVVTTLLVPFLGSDFDLQQNISIREQLARQITFGDEYEVLLDDAVASLMASFPAQGHSSITRLITIRQGLVWGSLATSILTLLALAGLGTVSWKLFIGTAIPGLTIALVAAITIANIVIAGLALDHNAAIPASGLEFAAYEQDLFSFFSTAASYPYSGDLMWLYRYREHDFRSMERYDPSDRLNALNDLGTGWFAQFISPADMGMVPDMEQKITEIEELRSRILLVTNVGETLTYAALHEGTQSVFNVTFLDTYWNLPEEADSHETRARYATQDQLYSTSSHDLNSALTKAEMLKLGKNTAMSARLLALRQEIEHKAHLLFDGLTAKRLETFAGTYNEQESMFNALSILGLTAALCLAALFAWVKYAQGFTLSFNASNTGSDTGAGNRSNSVHLSLLVVFAFIVTLICVENIHLSSSSLLDSQRRIDISTRRQWLVSRSMMLANSMDKDFTKVAEAQVTLHTILEDSKAMIQNLFFGAAFSQTASYYGIGRDPKQDYLLFASGSGSTAAGGIAINNPYTQCNATEGEATLAWLGRGVTLVFEQVWSQLLRELAIAHTPAEISAVVAKMKEVSVPLRNGLLQSSELYRDAELADSVNWAVASAVITGCCLLYLLFQHFWVFGDFSEDLLKDEMASQMMLCYIPPAIREENAAITNYMDSGTLNAAGSGGGSDINLQDAIATISTIPVICIDMQGTVLKFSTAAEEIFHYRASEVLGNNIKMLMPTATAKNHDGYLSAYRRTKVKTVIGTLRELKARRKDGTYFLAQLGIRELKFSDSDWVYVGFVKDISIEAATENDKAMNTKVLSMSPDPFITMDTQGTVQNCNPVVSDVFGYEPSEVIGENIKMLMPSDIAVHHDGYLKRYKETGIQHVINQTVVQQGQRKSGEVFKVRLMIREIKIGESTTFVGFISDISQELQRESGNAIGNIITDLSPVPLIAINNQGTIMKFSSAAAEVFGYNGEEVVSSHMNIQALVPPFYGPHYKFFEAYHATGEKKVIDKVRKVTAMRRDKTYIPVSLQITEVTTEGLDPMYLGYCSDMTEFAVLEEQKSLSVALTQSSPTTAMIKMNTGGLIQSINPAGEALFEFEPGELRGEPVTLLMNHHDGKAHQTYIDTYVSSRETFSGQPMGTARCVVARTKSGANFPVEIVVHYYGGTELETTSQKTGGGALKHRKQGRAAAAGQAGGGVGKGEGGSQGTAGLGTGTGLKLEAFFMAYITDITARRQLEQTTQTALTFMASCPKAIICMDQRGTVLQFSAGAEKCFTRAADEVLGQNISMLMPSEIASQHDNYLDRYLRTNEVHVINKKLAQLGKRKDGTFFSLELFIRECMLQDGDTGEGAEKAENLAKSVAASSSSDQMNKSKMSAGESSTSSASRVVGPNKKAHVLGSRFFMAEITDLTHLSNVKEDFIVGQTVRSNAVVACCFSTIEGEISFANPAAVSEFKFQSADAMTARGSNIRDLLDADSQSLILEVYGGVKKNGATCDLLNKKHRLQGLRQDNTTFALDLNVSYLHVQRSGVQGLVFYLHNVGSQLQLEESNKGIDSICHQSPIPIISIDTRGTIIKFSRAASVAFGYDASEAIGNNIKMIQPPEVADKHDAYLKTYQRTGYKVVLDNIVRQQGLRKDGSRFPIDLMIREVMLKSDENGGGDGMDDRLFLGYARDATSDEQLQEAMDLSSAIQQGSPTALIMMSRKGIVQVFSDAASRMFMYDSAEIVGYNIKKLMLPEVSKFHDSYLKAYAKTGIKTVLDTTKRQTGVRSTGEEFSLDLRICEIVNPTDKKLNVYVGYITEVTSLLHLQRAARLNDVVSEMSVQPLIVLDGVGTILKFSASAGQCFGCTPEEIIGQNVKRIMPEETAVQHDGFLSRRIRDKTKVGGGESFDRRVQAQRWNGEAFIADLSLLHIVDGVISSDLSEEEYLREKTERSQFVGALQDVSTKMSWEEKNELRDGALNRAPGPVIVMSLEGIVSKFNAAAETSFGYEATDVIGQNIKMLMPEEVSVRHDDILAQFLGVNKGKKPKVHTKKRVVAQRRNGSQFTCEVVIHEVNHPGMYGTEDQHFYIGYFIDITEELAAVAAAANTEATMKISTTACLTIDSIGTVQTINNAACRLFGYSKPEQVLDHNLKMLMPKPWSSEHDQYLKNYADTGVAKILSVPQKGLKGKRADGSTFLLSLTVELIAPLDATQKPLFVGILEAIDEKMTLVEQREKSKFASEVSLKPLILTNQTGNITQANANAARLFGFQNTEKMLGKNVEVLMNATDAQNHSRLIAQYLENTVEAQKKTGTKARLNLTRHVTGRNYATGAPMSLRLSLSSVFTDSDIRVQIKGNDPTQTNITFVALFDDITAERKTSYCAPLQRALFNMNTLPTVSISSTGIIKDFNAAAEQIFEFRKEQVRGKNVTILMPEKMHGVHDKALRTYLETRRKTVVDSSINVTGETKSGGKLHLELRVKQIVLPSGDLEFIGTLNPTK